MIMDSQELFAGTIAADGTRAGQAITATALGANVLDLRNSSLLSLADEGISGPELWLVVVVPQAFNNLTTLTITLESSASTGITSSTVHATAALPLAALTAGATAVRMQLPSADYLRYLGVRFTVAGTAPTLGTVIAFLTPDINRNVIYPSGFTVDA